jgi:hypothetical protein
VSKKLKKIDTLFGHVDCIDICNNLIVDNNFKLSSFSIKSKQVRLGNNKHGYCFADFEDTLTRYTPFQNATLNHL